MVLPNVIKWPSSGRAGTLIVCVLTSFLLLHYTLYQILLLMCNVFRLCVNEWLHSYEIDRF